MIDKWIAFDLKELVKSKQLNEAKSWYKSSLISQDQYNLIKQTFDCKLFVPNQFIRLLLFIATYFGISLGVAFFSISILESVMDEKIVRRVLLFLSGVSIYFFTERVFIKEMSHYKSGVVEAGTYISFTFIYLGILGLELDFPFVYWSVAFVFLCVITVRYLDLLALLGAIVSLIVSVFLAFDFIAAFLPFIVLIIFIGLYFLGNYLKNQVDKIIWSNHFVVFDYAVLMVIYLCVNYFVIRELSAEILGLVLEKGQDIPFAYFFYASTVLVPLVYLYWGIKTKSMVFIRISLITLAAAVFTFKYYFSLGHPEISLTIGGAILIVIALCCMKFLKTPKNGFTRLQLLHNPMENANLTAIISAQTLGGHAINSSLCNGGTSGGAGASGNF